MYVVFVYKCVGGGGGMARFICGVGEMLSAWRLDL